MKTVILICTPFGLENNISEIKRKIVEYTGVRLIKNNPDNIPIIELNNIIDVADKENISRIAEDVLETSAVFVIETDDDTFGSDGNMYILQPSK